MVEITVLSSGSGGNSASLYVPTTNEVHILGDVAAQHYARFVTEVAHVPLAVHKARNTRITRRPADSGYS